MFLPSQRQTAEIVGPARAIEPESLYNRRGSIPSSVRTSTCVMKLIYGQRVWQRGEWSKRRIVLTAYSYQWGPSCGGNSWPLWDPQHTKFARITAIQRQRYEIHPRYFLVDVLHNCLALMLTLAMASCFNGRQASCEHTHNGTCYLLRWSTQVAHQPYVVGTETGATKRIMTS